MIGKILFYVLTIALLAIIFLKMMRKNDIVYLISLIVQALGIIISFLSLIFTFNINLFFKILIFIFTMVCPITILVCEKKGINLTEIIHISIAKGYLMLRMPKRAKRILIALIEKNSDIKIAHKMLAEIYESEGGIRKAIDEYVKVVDLDSHAYDSYYKIAVLLKELGNKDDSMNMLKQLVNKKPDYLEASIAYSDALCEQERYKEALSIMNESLKHHPNNFEVYYNMGMVYTMLNDFSSAKECYEKAAEINSLEYHSNYNIAMIELILGELDDAQKHFNECLEDEKLSPLAYYQLAKVCMLKSDKETASQYLNLAIELDNTLYRKAMEDSAFIPIKGYINYPFMDKEEPMIQEEDKKDLSKEDQVIEHLEKTYGLVGKLNYREFGAKQFARERDNEIQREQ